jgi:hypothetical protein
VSQSGSSADDPRAARQRGERLTEPHADRSRPEPGLLTGAIEVQSKREAIAVIDSE